MPVHRFLLLPAVLLCTLATAPVASAAITISRSAGTIAITGDSGDNVVFETGFDDTTPWYTTPAPATLTAGTGCTQLSANNVECPGTAAPSSAVVNLGAGDDLFLWSGTATALTINGGGGDDELSGSSSADTITGGSGDDILVGFAGNDRIDGDDGRDVIDGSGGDDRIEGGEGIDKLNGDGEGEAPVKQFGNDTILSRDGSADEVDCENGTDTVRADALDTVASSCESISRSADSDNPSDGSSGPSPVRTPAVNRPSVTVSTADLTLKVRRYRLPRINAFASSAAVRVLVTASSACRATTTLRVSSSEARRLRYRASRTLNRVTDDVPASTSTLIAVRGSSAFRKAIRGKRAAFVTLEVVCTPSTGKPVTAKLALRLTR